MTRRGGRLPLPATAAALAVLPLLAIISPVVLAQAPAAPAAAGLGPGSEAFFDGAALFRDANYEAAVPRLQQATQQDPQLESAWYYLGVTLFKLERYAEAIPAFEKASALAEFRPGTRFYLGQIYEVQGDYERALDTYATELRIRRARNTDEVLTAVGRTQWAAGKYEDALISLARALEEDPNYVEAVYYRGLAFDGLGRPEAATQEFQKAKAILEERDRLKGRLQRLSVGERREAALTQQIYAQKYARAEEFVVDRKLRPQLSKDLGNAFTHSGDYERARMQYRASMSAAEMGSQADPEAHVLLGRAFMHEGYELLVFQGYIKGGALVLDAGVEEFNKALGYDPNSADAYVGIGRVYTIQAANYGTDPVRNITSHKYDEAIASFQQALAIDPDSSDALKYLGEAYNRQGEYQLARQQLEAGIALAPKDAGMYAQLAASLVGLEQYTEAITQAETALAMDPKDYDALSALGLAHYYLGDLGRAVPAFERAINLQPKNHQGYTNLGNAYFQARSWHRARENYDRALQLIPQATIAGTLYQRAYLHYLIGRAYTNASMYPFAIGAFNQALGLDGTYFECLLALADTHLKAGEYRAAADALRDALSKSETAEDDSRVHLMLGQVYEAARRPHDATIEYGLALRADPNNAAAQRALERLQQRVTTGAQGGAE